jgi:ribosomal protein S18 acetylase RimI-like enzyme
MLATLIGSWSVIAEGSDGATIERLSGGVAAIFPAGPERLFYNNAVLARGLDEDATREATDAILARYTEAGVKRYAIWVHDAEDAGMTEMAGRGFRVDTATRAMAMSLHEIALERPEIDLGPSDWSDYLRILEVPEGTLAGVDPGEFHVLIGRLDGDAASACMAYYHDGDCGIFNLGTLEPARRRGLGSALTALQLHQARERGCTTASLQSTEVAEGIYRSVGFRDLGRFIEYAP